MTSPPIKVWVFTTLILGLVIVFTKLYRGEIRRYLFRNLIEVAFNLSEAKEKDVRVVILCSSHGKEGISDPPVLSSLANQNEEGTTYSFVKIVRTAAMLEDFTENEFLFNKIATFDPHYVVIQESFCFMKRDHSAKTFGVQNDLQLMRQFQILRHGAPNVCPKWLSNSVQKLGPKFDTLRREYTSVLESKTVRENDRKLSRFIRKIGRYTVIAHIPAPAPIETKLDSIRNTKEYISIYEDEKLRGNFSAFWFKQPMPYKYFYDRGHLNDRGEEIYTQWFVNQLQKLHQSQNQGI